MISVFGIIYVCLGILFFLSGILLTGFLFVDLGLFMIIMDILIKRKQKKNGH